MPTTQVVTHPWHKKCPYCESKKPTRRLARWFPIPYLFRSFWRMYHKDRNFREGILLTIMLIEIVAVVCLFIVFLVGAIDYGIASPLPIISGPILLFIMPPLIYRTGVAIGE